MGSDPNNIFPDGMFPDGMFPDGMFPGEGSEPPDESPDAFAFTNVTGATLSQVRNSNTITVTGLGDGVSVPVTVSGSAQYSKNGGGYTASDGTAENGDTFSLQMTASASYSTTVSGTLEIGDQADAWSVRTQPDPSAVGANGFIDGAAFVGFIQ
jgi:hypothetical protein